MHRLRSARDPFWDMDGHGVRRDRKRGRLVGITAMAIAIVAVGLTAAAWIREIVPYLGGVTLG